MPSGFLPGAVLDRVVDALSDAEKILFATDFLAYYVQARVETRWPEPSRRRRVVCSMAVRPRTIRPANTAHDRQMSWSPALRTTISTVTTMLARDSAACWTASPQATSGRGVSSGS